MEACASAGRTVCLRAAGDIWATLLCALARVLVVVLAMREGTAQV